MVKALEEEEAVAAPGEVGGEGRYGEVLVRPKRR